MNIPLGVGFRTHLVLSSSFDIMDYKDIRLGFVIVTRVHLRIGAGMKSEKVDLV